MTFETDMMSCDPDLLVFWCMAHTTKVFGSYTKSINLSKDERPNTRVGKAADEVVHIWGRDGEGIVCPYVGEWTIN